MVSHHIMCKHVCLSACLPVCMYVCMHACLHVCMSVCMNVHIIYIDAGVFLIQSDRAAEKKQKGDKGKDPCHSMSSDEGQCTATAGCEFVTKSGKTNCYTPQKGGAASSGTYIHAYIYIHTYMHTDLPKTIQAREPALPELQVRGRRVFCDRHAAGMYTHEAEI